MSCKNDAFDTKVKVNAYVKYELLSDERFSEEEKQGLEFFRKIRQDADFIFLWTCAQMVADEMQSEDSRVRLTEDGITTSELLENYYYIDSDAPKERQRFASFLVNKNKEFLIRWMEMVNKMREQRNKINTLSQETRELIDKNMCAVQKVQSIVQMLLKDGFTPTDPNIINIKPVTYFLEGIHIHAENEFKEVRDVWIFPDGKAKFHVDAPDSVLESKGISCAELGQNFAIQCALILNEGRNNCGLPGGYDIGPSYKESANKDVDWKHLGQNVSGTTQSNSYNKN